MLTRETKHIAIIGAGIGGLASALRLANAGFCVDVFEAHSAPGGKMRTLPTAAGPVDAGPTVLTMLSVFEDLFKDVGTSLAAELTLLPQNRLARHFWQDGTELDLYADPLRNAQEIERVFGTSARQDFRAFQARTKTLFDAFAPIMMEAPNPTLTSVTLACLKNPRLLAAMPTQTTLQKLLRKTFREPKLAQLFGRYATYVGGSPTAAPAILSLIWQSEARGVWQVDGGMQCLARTVERLAAERGARFHYNTPVGEIITDKNCASGIIANGQKHCFDAVLFAGDPAALHRGFLGEPVRSAVQNAATHPRSHSADVWSFAAKPKGRPLGLHNVFFADHPTSEFEDLEKGKTPNEPSIYIYAQDRGTSTPPTGLERFEIILNAPPVTISSKETAPCPTQIFQMLETMGLRFHPRPELSALTTPSQFNQLFPGSDGSLYGLSPHGMMAAFQRPRARTKIKGLYLTGGGAHPGAGVPMATLSAQHAAAAILSDLTSTSTSRRMVTHGGMSTA